MLFFRQLVIRNDRWCYSISVVQNVEEFQELKNETLRFFTKVE